MCLGRNSISKPAMSFFIISRMNANCKNRFTYVTQHFFQFLTPKYLIQIMQKKLIVSLCYVYIFRNLIMENWVNLFSSAPLTFIVGRYMLHNWRVKIAGKCCSLCLYFHWEGTKTSQNQRRYCFPIFLHTWQTWRCYTQNGITIMQSA